MESLIIPWRVSQWRNNGFQLWVGLPPNSTQNQPGFPSPSFLSTWEASFLTVPLATVSSFGEHIVKPFFFCSYPSNPIGIHFVYTAPLHNPWRFPLLMGFLHRWQSPFLSTWKATSTPAMQQTRSVSGRQAFLLQPGVFASENPSSGIFLMHIKYCTKSDYVPGTCYFQKVFLSPLFEWSQLS